MRYRRRTIIVADIMALEKETEGLLHEIVDDVQGVSQ